MPRKKSSTTTVIFVILGICAVCCIGAVLLVVGGSWFALKKVKGLTACVVGFTEAGQAMQDYADAHQGKLPNAATWQTDITPYFKKRYDEDQQQGAKFFGSFDPGGNWVCKDDSGGNDTGIAFNSDLSGEKLDDIKNKGTTIVLFEVPKTGRNLNEAYVELSKSSSPKVMNKPRGWFTVNADFKVTGTDNENTTISFNGG